MSVKTVVGLATAGCACFIVMSLVAVCVIFNDINSLYDDVMDEMGEFKVLVLSREFTFLIVLSLLIYKLCYSIYHFLLSSDEDNSNNRRKKTSPIFSAS